MATRVELSVGPLVTLKTADNLHVDPYAALLVGEELAHNFPSANVPPAQHVEDTLKMGAVLGLASCSREDAAPCAAPVVLDDDNTVDTKHVPPLEVHLQG